MLFIAFNEFVTFYGDFFICAIYAEFFYGRFYGVYDGDYYFGSLWGLTSFSRFIIKCLS